MKKTIQRWKFTKFSVMLDSVNWQRKTWPCCVLAFELNVLIWKFPKLKTCGLWSDGLDISGSIQKMKFWNASMANSHGRKESQARNWFNSPELSKERKKEKHWRVCVHAVSVFVVFLLIQLNPRAQNVSLLWKKPHRQYKYELWSIKH
jgi:hypothetical protein